MFLIDVHFLERVMDKKVKSKRFIEFAQKMGGFPYYTTAFDNKSKWCPSCQENKNGRDRENICISGSSDF